jgi:hypothetical protein
MMQNLEFATYQPSTKSAAKHDFARNTTALIHNTHLQKTNINSANRQLFVYRIAPPQAATQPRTP